jgi:hypothetical protein
MTTEAELKKRIAALGRGLRPLEREVEAILGEMDSLIEADQDFDDDLGLIEDSGRLDWLYTVVDEIGANIRAAREDIVRCLRPRECKR